MSFLDEGQKLERFVHVSVVCYLYPGLMFVPVLELQSASNEMKINR